MPCRLQARSVIHHNRARIASNATLSYENSWRRRPTNVTFCDSIEGPEEKDMQQLDLPYQQKYGITHSVGCLAVTCSLLCCCALLRLFFFFRDMSRSRRALDEDDEAKTSWAIALFMREAPPRRALNRRQWASVGHALHSLGLRRLQSCRELQRSAEPPSQFLRLAPCEVPPLTFHRLEGRLPQGVENRRWESVHLKACVLIWLLYFTAYNIFFIK